MSDALENDSFWKLWGKTIVKLARCLSREQAIELSEMRQIVPIPEGAATSWAHLGGDYLDKVAALKWDDLMPFPRTKAALVIANWLSPLDKVKDCRCVLLQGNDLIALIAKQSLEAAFMNV